MKKIILILLCLPYILLSKEERKYEKTISFSQFAKELKEAADKGNSYILEDHYITYDSIRDREYTRYTAKDWISGKIKKKFIGDMQIKDLSFNKSTKVEIVNCRFGKSEENWQTTIKFTGCSFDTLFLSNIDVGSIYIDTSNISYLRYISILDMSNENIKEELSVRYNQNNYNALEIKNSKIKWLDCSGNSIDNIVGKNFPYRFM